MKTHLLLEKCTQPDRTIICRQDVTCTLNKVNSTVYSFFFFLNKNGIKVNAGAKNVVNIWQWNYGVVTVSTGTCSLLSSVGVSAEKAAEQWGSVPASRSGPTAAVGRLWWSTAGQTPPVRRGRVESRTGPVSSCVCRWEQTLDLTFTVHTRLQKVSGLPILRETVCVVIPFFYILAISSCHMGMCFILTSTKMLSQVTENPEDLISGAQMLVFSQWINFGFVWRWTVTW